jgi:rSAM/selenodomain-associated transferase 1
MSHVNTERKAPVAVAILAKAPIPGLAKTRLIPHLGADGAAALQRWLLHRTVTTALAADIGPVSLWCAPEADHPDFAACLEHGPLSLYRQPDADLGERMRLAIAESTAAGGTLVVGTDCPLLTPDHLQQAAAALADHDAVVVPAEDGGYVMIGMQEARHQVFSDVAWSTEGVMAQTRQRLASIGWKWAEFAPLWDVDRSEDFERLLQCLPETRRFVPVATAT